MADRLHLSAKHRRILEKLLREHLPGVEVWAYGSRVNDRSHDGSDLDLVLRGAGLNEIPIGQLADFDEAVRESNIPFLVEARDWARLPDRSHRQISRDYITFVGRSAPKRHPLSGSQLCDHAEIVMGQSPPGSACNMSGEGMPLLNGPTEFGPHHPTPSQFTTDPQRKALFGDILFCVRGSTTGRMNWADQDYAIGRGIAAIRHRNDRKLQPLVRSVIEQDLPSLLAQATGSTFPNVSAKQLTTVPWPSLELTEQRAIAHVLGTLDDKIELNRRMNETLEAMARAIFKDWFVDFGPTRAKIEDRAPYLPPELWALFPDALDEQDKPIGWSLATLTALADMNPESWSKRNCPEEIEYVDLANTKWGRIEATQHFGWQDAPSRAKRILRPGDTIVGMVRPGNGSFAFIGGTGLTGSTGFAVLRPLQRRYRTLVYLSATAPENIHRLANLADGAAYPAVRPEVVGATEVAVPDDAVTNSFSALVSPIFDRMTSIKKQEHTLAWTRDLLLPKLISGELQVSAPNILGVPA